ncbi:hypothetical protein ACWGR4_27120 [Embleya sp. NPDC055664]
MHVFQRPVVRFGALLLAVLYVLFEVVRARGGVLASSLLLVVYLVVAVVSAWWWLFSFAARVRRGWPALSKAIGAWQQEPVSRIDETFEYRFPRILRIRRHELGFDVTVSLLPGQTPKNLGDHVEGIAHTWASSGWRRRLPGGVWWYCGPGLRIRWRSRSRRRRCLGWAMW